MNSGGFWLPSARCLREKSAAVCAGLVWGFLCAFFCLALCSALWPLFAAENPLAVFSDVSIVRTAWTTLRLALVSTCIAVFLGVVGAFFCARRNFPGKRFLLSLAPVPLCVPPLLIALGFVMFYGMRGTANSFLMNVFSLRNPPLTFLYSFYGVVVAHGFYNFPIVMRTCTDAWRTLTAEHYDAAVMLGAGKFRVFRTVTVVQLLPAILSSGSIVFLYCFFSFVIVLLFGGIGVTVLEVEIFQSVRSSLNFTRAAALALVELCIAMGVVAVYAVLERKSAGNSGISFGSSARPPKNISAAEAIPALLFFAAVLLFLLAPLLCIVFNAFKGTPSGYASRSSGGFLTPVHFFTLFSRASFWKAFANTVFVAAFSSFFSVCGAFFFACILKAFDPRKKNVALRVVPLLPMAVSSIVIGSGFTRLPIAATPLALVVAQSSLAWPFALRQISAGMDRIPQEITEAARLLSPGLLPYVFKVYLPMTARHVVSAFGFCFAVSCGDTNLPLALAVPRFETVALYTYKLAGSYHFQEACACGTVLAALTMSVFAAGAVAGGRKNALRHGGRNGAW